ncbi:MAG: type ISP restriction/modification enzyme, partial [Terracidiphilus sp.]
NRLYKHLDRQIADTYAKASIAQNKNGLRDPYVRALGWASARIGDEGIVAFVINRKFIQGKAADGIRHYLSRDFTSLFLVDLGGDVRSNPKLSGTKHNVFGIQTGICIALLIKHKKGATASTQLNYTSAGEMWTKAQKFAWLQDSQSSSNMQWGRISPSERNDWLTSSTDEEFSTLVPLQQSKSELGIFEVISNGLKSNRDAWAFNFSASVLRKNIRRTIDFFNAHVRRWRTVKSVPVDQFVENDDHSISWSRDLKKALAAGREIGFEERNLTQAIYRPYTKTLLYFDGTLNEEIYQLPHVFPPRKENAAIVVTAHQQVPFSAQSVQLVPCVDLGGRPSQLFPLYIYDEDGTNRRENITDWALAEFRSHYGRKSISKLDIFHYTYALLHHPKYRARYAANLKRELPRIPFAPDFPEYARIGADLMRLHLEYEKQPEYPLERRETGKLDWRVEKMALSKDKTQLKYNQFLTLSGIPPEVYEYRLGNRSALEWVVDQYRVTTDKRSGIVNDPNRADDPEYIVRLIGQVVTVSLETVRLVRELAALPLLPVTER